MILINGCSFTAPSRDTNSWAQGFGRKNFSTCINGISNQYNQFGSIKNVAAGGASNDVIRRKTFYYLNDYYFGKEIRYAIIQWSTIDRWDYPVYVTKEKANNFPRIAEFPERINSINYMHNGTDVFGYAKDFYEKYYSLYGAVLQTLENIYHTQTYLKEKKIPYKMITIGNLLDMDATISKLQYLQQNTRGDYSVLKTNKKNIYEKLEKYDSSWFEMDNIKCLLEKIDFSNFLFTDNENINGFGGGIIEWFINQNEILAGGNFHPSQSQHLRFFELFLYPKIEKELNAIFGQKFSPI